MIETARPLRPELGNLRRGSSAAQPLPLVEDVHCAALAQADRPGIRPRLQAQRRKGGQRAYEVLRVLRLRARSIFASAAALQSKQRVAEAGALRNPDYCVYRLALGVEKAEKRPRPGFRRGNDLGERRLRGIDTNGPRGVRCFCDQPDLEQAKKVDSDPNFLGGLANRPRAA